MMRDERTEDKPPYSRVFVVCNKQHRLEDLRSLFEKYGEVEDLHLPRDRSTGDIKGIAYVKFVKTSSAAAAIDALHMKHVQNCNKPLKVMVATTKNEEKNVNENKYKRLFIKVSKDSTENGIKDHFSRFGHVEQVHIQRDRETLECRGFAYIHYKTFYEAAIAYEQCDKIYKPVFAIPREVLKRTRNSIESFDRFPSSDSLYTREHRNEIDPYYKDHSMRDGMIKKDGIFPLIKTTPGDYDTVHVVCNPCVPQKSLEKLFDIIPEMLQFKFTIDHSKGICLAAVKYESRVAAAHAVASLNNYEFPSGQIISVKPENTLSNVADSLSKIVNSFKTSLDSNSDLMQLADAIAQASTLLKAATSGVDTKAERSNDDFCNVPLPPVQPRANSDAKVAQRCFLVFKPHPLPLPILRDIFCRFGGLIDVNIIPNKTYGFAKYASLKSAQDAINTLHEATVHGIKLKVLEAEEMRKENRDDKMEDDDNEHTDKNKRARLDEK